MTGHRLPHGRLPAGWHWDRPRGCTYCPWCDHRTRVGPGGHDGRVYIYRCERRPAFTERCEDYAALRAQEREA